MLYPIVPGRGLVTTSGTQLRLSYLEEAGMALSETTVTTLEPEAIRHNIESFVGSTEIPLGLVGPLLYNGKDKEEWVYTLAGTLEGALVASMNRGAKALSLSGGFSAQVLHQKMIRTPMFIFKTLNESMAFKHWVDVNFKNIKSVAEQYSNHAKLTAILPYVTGKSVHLKFVYTTGDASGQNMTTSCTWHSILWIKKQFEQETDVEIVHFIVEGNGASDKKVSIFSMNHGRGIHVVAECHVKEEVLAKVMRTTSADIVRCFNQSLVMSRLDGMIGYNINVANAIAAIFAATGQDLGSLHESSCGILNVEKTDEGLYLSLNLPSLVIGTVGGGTHLPRQREALELMDCYGTGNLPRFACLIAGFALALELSTYAAIVSGQFAIAHEKLGRNKPVNWLLKSEINRSFMEKHLNGKFENRTIQSVDLLQEHTIGNGMLSELTSKVSKKLIGFFPVKLAYLENNAEKVTEASHCQLLIKSKPLDQEVFKGLHLMATSINSDLSHLIYEHRDSLEYKNCHEKEIKLYELLHKHKLPYKPELFGKLIDEKREIHLIVQELLDVSSLLLYNADNQPGLWDEGKTKHVIYGITKIHQAFSEKKEAARAQEIGDFKPWLAKPLYRKLAQLVDEGVEDGLPWHEQTFRLYDFIEELEQEHQALEIPRSIIHNDFNPRNIAIRQDGTPCFYDWELAVVHIPHRDVVEFLSFTLEENFPQQRLQSYLEYHYELYADQQQRPDWETWKKGYVYALKEYLVTRVSFYLVVSLLLKYEFADRIINNAFRMLNLLEEKKLA